MSESMIRGYSLRRTAAFIDVHFDPDTAARVKRDIRDSLELAATVKPAEWYPRRHSAAMFRAIATAKQDPTDIYRDLVACGTYICAEATNTFFRVLLKIMTPALFAKKLPSFWNRDHQGGGYEYDISDVDNKVLALRLVNVADYDHIAPVAVGFCEFVLSTMGKRGVRIVESNWSIDAPAPADVDFRVTWE